MSFSAKNQNFKLNSTEHRFGDNTFGEARVHAFEFESLLLHTGQVVGGHLLLAHRHLEEACQLVVGQLRDQLDRHRVSIELGKKFKEFNLQLGGLFVDKPAEERPEQGDIVFPFV